MKSAHKKKKLIKSFIKRSTKKKLTKKKLTRKKANKKIYFTHDNGTRPFMVKIENDKCSVYLRLSNMEPKGLTTRDIYLGKANKPENYESTPRFIFDCQNIFVANPSDKLDKGNSVLIKVKNKYIFIGDSLFSFEALAPIKEFKSEVGNNDVPYPFAVDTDNNYYLLTPGTLVVLSGWSPSNDIYEDYFDFQSKRKKAHQEKTVTPLDHQIFIKRFFFDA